jgi:hypothetical protein
MKLSGFGGQQKIQITQTKDARQNSVFPREVDVM